jgi:hypothetical protein
VAAVALEKGCERLQWEVLDWNTPAIDFYSAMGAEFLDDWRNVRLSGDAIKRLAEKTGESGLPPFSAKNAEKDGAPGHSTHPPFRQEAGERMGQPAENDAQAEQKSRAGATP